MKTKSGRKRTDVPQSVRFDVLQRDGFRCVYCGAASSPSVILHCDHVIAVANGGSNEKSNLVTACSDCNFGKGAKKLTSQPPRQRAANDNGLIGLFGHTRDEGGRIHWQFEITGMVGVDHCTIQLFSWLDGRATEIKIYPVSDLSNCSLYSTRDEWVWAWAKESARNMGKGEDWAEGTFYLSTGRRRGRAAA